MPASFFTTEDNEWFSPTSHSRGPWHPDHCHAGPPTGLIARALELSIPEQRLTRLTINLSRPIPFGGFRIVTTISKKGRNVSIADASLIDQHEKVCVTAHSLHMTKQAEEPLPTTVEPALNPDDATIGRFPISRALHDLPSFRGDGVEVKYPDGNTPEPGPTTVWMRTVPLLANETPSPFQRICPLADCGNAFGRNAEPWEYNFLNPDLTILLHRDPIGEWLGMRARSHWQPDGIGMSDAELMDQSGCVGRALQTLLIKPTA